MPLEQRIRVLLADANPAFVDAVARCLAFDRSLALVGRAATAADTLRQVDQLRPDLVLLDIRLRDMSGLEVARQIKCRPNPPRVVVLAFNEGAEYHAAARAAGADGFVAKTEFFEQMHRLIHAWYVELGSPGRVPDGTGT
jgi:two-component system nitrate/nitrite response regulator NarL